MCSPKDKGSYFLTNASFDYNIPHFNQRRRRANTFPSSYLNDPTPDDPRCNYNNSDSDDDISHGKPFIKSSGNIGRNNKDNVVKNYDKRDSLGDSPKTPLKHMDVNDGDYMKRNGHYNDHNHLDNSYDSPQTMHSMFSNMSSPMMTPITLYNGLNGLHMPIRPYVNYPGIYSPIYGNGMFNRNLHASPQMDPFIHSDPITEMARSHRNAATHADARHTWSGTLPTGPPNKTPIYSCKVFLGGVPWEMNDHDIKLTFSRFGNVNILRPGQHVRLSRTSQNKEKAGYLYLIFESDKQVKSLLNSCTHDFSNGGKYYFALNQPRYRPKDVQIIPWNSNDTSYVKSPSARVDANKTVFVGALHGMLTAEGLACILEDLFGGVVYVGIDTDKYKYPIGSGRVTFNSTKAYVKAVQAGFIDVKSTRFHKKIQIDPFLEESNCANCRTNKGPIFCRDACMRYLCRTCWDIIHASDNMKSHQPIMRNKTKF